MLAVLVTEPGLLLR